MLSEVTTLERTELDRSQREEELRVLSTEVKDMEIQAEEMGQPDVLRKYSLFLYSPCT